MSGDFASVAMGVVIGWQLMRARGIMPLLWGLRLIGAAAALLLLTILGPGHPLLALGGLIVGIAGHAFLIAQLQRREKIR
jgi:hypothetical protein